MGGYYRLDAQDARRLGAMVGAMSTDRSRVNRATMTLYCWSQMQAKGAPCPFFRVGLRTIARECDVNVGTAREFLNRAEEGGWVLRLGEERNGRGRFVRRTFWWVAEEAAEASGMALDEWLRKAGGVQSEVHTGVHQKEHDPVQQAQQKGAHPCVPPPAEPQVRPPVFAGGCTYQSTEYSEGDAPPASSESAAERPSTSGGGVPMPPRPDWPS